VPDQNNAVPARNRKTKKGQRSQKHHKRLTAISNTSSRYAHRTSQKREKTPSPRKPSTLRTYGRLTAQSPSIRLSFAQSVKMWSSTPPCASSAGFSSAKVASKKVSKPRYLARTRIAKESNLVILPALSFKFWKRPSSIARIVTKSSNTTSITATWRNVLVALLAVQTPLVKHREN
jgi:hypothetical protein